MMKTSALGTGTALLLLAGVSTSACGSEVLTPHGGGGADPVLLCGPEPEPAWCGPYTCEEGMWKPPCCGPPDCCGPKPESAVPGCSVWCNDGAWFAACECPAELPAEGSPCPEPGLQEFPCSYKDGACGTYASAHCDEGAVHIEYLSSPCCPDAVPASGSACEVGELVCEYRSCAGHLLVSCASGSWVIALLEPPLPCAEASTEVDCQGIAGCRYLFPGCVDEPGGPPGVTGCFPELDCDPSDEPTPATCTTVNHDPCHGKKCDVCSAEKAVCLP